MVKFIFPQLKKAKACFLKKGAWPWRFYGIIQNFRKEKQKNTS